MRSRVVRSGLLLAVLSAAAWADSAPELNVCPQAAPSSRSGTLNTAYEAAVATNGTCNQAFVFNADGTVRIVAGNPYPFAGSKGTLIGVVNNHFRARQQRHLRLYAVPFQFSAVLPGFGGSVELRGERDQLHGCERGA